MVFTSSGKTFQRRAKDSLKEGERLSHITKQQGLYASGLMGKLQGPRI